MLGAITMATLSKKQIKRNENRLAQVLATLSIEDMHMSRDDRQRFLRVARGEMTTTELIAEFDKEYARQ